jgi:small subunit ribosomal protein S6
MSRNAQQNLYEGMYIISSTLSDDARQKAFDKIQNGIIEHDGKVLKVHDMGRKRLAYDIKGHREGHYYLVYFEVTPEAIEDLWKDYHLNEDLVRFCTLRTDKVSDKIEFKALAEQ